MSPLGSVALTGSPALVPPGEFSSTCRVAASAPNSGGSFLTGFSVAACAMWPCPALSS